MTYINSLLEDNKKPPVKSPDGTFNKAHARLVALYGEKTTALKLLAQAVAKNPDVASANYGYGLCLARNNQSQKAIFFLAAALKKNPHDPYIAKDMGRIYFLAEDYQQAEKILKSIPRLGENGAEGLLYLGRSQLALGKNKDAEKTLKGLIAKYPDDQDGLFSLGKSLWEQNKKGSAHYYLGLYNLEKKNTATADFHFNQALKLTNDLQLKEKIQKILEEEQGG